MRISTLILVLVTLCTSPSAAQTPTSEPEQEPHKLVQHTIDNLIDMFQSTKDQKLRVRLLEILSNVETDSAHLLQFLFETSRDPDESIAAIATTGLKRFPIMGEQTESLVLDWLKSNEPEKVEQARELLSGMELGKLEKELVQLIDTGMINDETRDEIFNIFMLRRRISDESMDEFDRLYAERPELRLSILKMIDTIPAPPGTTLKLLNRVIRGDDDQSRDLALSSIEKILNLSSSTEQHMAVTATLSHYDKNGDGQITAEEDGRITALMDRNKDGRVTRRELTDFYGESLNRRRAVGRSDRTRSSRER